MRSSKSRLLAQGVIAVLAASPIVAIAATVYSVSVTSVSAISIYSAKAPNGVRGTISFKINGAKTAVSLYSYWNGGTTGSGAGSRQCPEVIQRYARLLGFKNFGSVQLSGDNAAGKLPGLGDGSDAASNFAAKSDKGFAYVKNGSTSLPRPGAVVSISGYSVDGVLRIDGGHVGIAMPYTTPDKKTTSVSIQLFDQNMPNTVTDWRPVVFRKDSNGNWTGSWTNKSRDHMVIGWANPS